MKIHQKLSLLGLVLYAATPFSDASARAQDRVQPNAVSLPENGKDVLSKDNLSIATLSPSSGFSIGALVSQYAADQKTLDHRFRLPLDKIGQEYRMKMLQSWQEKLAAIDFSQLDQDNQIKANVTYKFPKPGWSIKAAGPEGTNRVLFVVSQSPRDSKIFALDEVSGGGPFAFSLAEMTARKRLVDFFLGRGIKGKNGQMAASLVSVAEVP